MDEGDRAAVLGVLQRSAEAIVACRAMADDITAVAERIAHAFALGHKLLICGNGGSAADAQHFAGELMGRFLASASERAPRPAIALSADSAVLTCISNDYAFEEVFARQVRGRVAEMTEQGADAHIDALAKKYLGKDKYPYRRPDEVRVTVKILPEKVQTLG